ncbi:DUF6518 family protein [Actinoplanes friuliensis]|uniref:DUF6518 family protein n=1 Tax=Actinoplanes friuliensis TaxID=196914 RepID=UPI0005A2B379|nr:DUF6518 family protein [Actinoplanes friuliensis]
MPARKLALVACLGGVALGVVDFILQKILPYPWANLANSSAVWAVAAFALGCWVRTGLLRAAAAAVTLLVIAVPSYYLAATLIQQDNLSNAWAPTSLLWMFFGVLAGVVFGPAGVWARSSGWHQIAGTALPAAVLLAEAARLLNRNLIATAVIEAALGLALIVIVGRSNRVRLLALAAALPLAAIGFLGFELAGFA